MSSTTTTLPPRRQVVRAHVLAQLRDLLRTPIAVVSNTIFPAMSFLFFVLPIRSVVESPTASLVVVAQLGVFGVMSAFLFGYGIGVAEDRASPWTTYLRTLPTGSVPPTVARLVVALCGATMSLVPLLLAVAVLTRAPDAFGPDGLPWWRLGTGILAVLAAGIPFLGMGLAIGYSMTSRAAVAVAQVLAFPLAFIGGLFIPPDTFPGWVETVSLATPARAARDLAAAALLGTPAPGSTLPVFAGWTVAMAAVALWAYRRDEGRRFR